MCEKFHQLLAVGRWFPPGTPVSSTRKLISTSSFHRLDMTLAVAEALNPTEQTNRLPNSWDQSSRRRHLLEVTPTGGDTYWRGHLLEGTPTGGDAYWRGRLLEGTPGGDTYWRGRLLEGTPTGGDTYWRGRLLEGTPTGGDAWRGHLLEGTPTGGDAYWRGHLLEGTPTGGPWDHPGFVSRELLR